MNFQVTLYCRPTRINRYFKLFLFPIRVNTIFISIEILPQHFQRHMFTCMRGCNCREQFSVIACRIVVTSLKCVVSGYRMVLILAELPCPMIEVSSTWPTTESPDGPVTSHLFADETTKTLPAIKTAATFPTQPKGVPANLPTFQQAARIRRPQQLPFRGNCRVAAHHPPLCDLPTSRT